jgi:integrase
MPVYRRKFKTKDKWCVYVIFPNGRRYRRVVGTKKEAEKLQRKLESEIVEGKWQLRDKGSVSFNTLTKKYLKFSETTHVASTFRARKYRIKKHLKPYFGRMQLDQITVQMLDNYKEMRKEAGASQNTVNHELANLSHMLRMAIRWGYIDKNVASHVDRMKVPKTTPRFLSEDEIAQLIDAAKGLHIYPLVVTALHTGMRKGELFNLQWADIDFGQQIIRIESKVDWHTKNYRPRVIQLTPMLYKVLSEHRDKQARIGNQSEYVFTFRGKKLRSNIKRAGQECLKGQAWRMLRFILSAIQWLHSLSWQVYH